MRILPLLLISFIFLNGGCVSTADNRTKTEILTQAFEEANRIQREHRIAMGELVRSNYSPEAAKAYFERWMPFFDSSEKVRREYFLAKVAIDVDSIDWQSSIWRWALYEPNRRDFSNLGKTHPEIARSLHATWKESQEVGKKIHANIAHDAYNALHNKHGGKWNYAINKRLKIKSRLKALDTQFRKEMRRASSDGRD